MGILPSSRDQSKNKSWIPRNIFSIMKLYTLVKKVMKILCLWKHNLVHSWILCWWKIESSAVGFIKLMQPYFSSQDREKNTLFWETKKKSKQKDYSMFFFPGISRHWPQSNEDREITSNGLVICAVYGESVDTLYDRGPIDSTKSLRTGI